MRRAMATCEVGDDVFGDDPTVIELEKKVADLVGTEASLWCPTGTMANSVAVATHTVPGQEVIAGGTSHVVTYELGSIGWVAHCQLRTVSDIDGRPDPREIDNLIREETLHTPGTGLLCLENTHNVQGGRVMPFDLFVACADLARKKGVKVHLDGARIWNASTASGIPVRDYVKHVDSIMFCLSKGLGSPAGSMLCANREFIGRARRFRKRQGGALRQVGVLAACGLVSIDEMIPRLGNDHKSAKQLASQLVKNGLLDINLDNVETNICIFTPPLGASWTNDRFHLAARTEGLLVTIMYGNRIRMVTHNDFNPAWTDEVVARAGRAIGKIS